MKIGVVPFYKGQNNNKLFDINDCNLNTDNALTPYYQIKNLLNADGIEVNTIDYYKNITDVDFILFFSLNYNILKMCLKEKISGLIYFAWEPEVVDKRHSKRELKKLEPFFNAIMTWNDDLIDNKKYFKINYPHYFEANHNNTCSKKEFEKKKLLVNISGNKASNHPKELYSERLKVIEYFEKKNNKDFELYGGVWSDKLACLKGKCLSKFKVYANFKFALCLENMHDVKGYITEKIFDCFTAGIVPIYWGATNINKYIPKNCFINYKDFKNIQDLDKYLTSMPYEVYIKYISSINDFLNSDKIDDFSPLFFVNSLEKAIKSNVVKKSQKNSLFLLHLYRIIHGIKTGFKKITFR